ncbi:DUF721 domain-containing protein [Futiania mangrovi]|uniref:DciA family protein n=1 Tax=Futiania mangrovi TaxID=2959716 RepID=A0A9J6PLR4_9PROT|nr:DciA family protein [Futiania mangrovii]MCP1337583.1 DciA family protein [Futiania mangrovii]
MGRRAPGQAQGKGGAGGKAGAQDDLFAKVAPDAERTAKGFQPAARSGSKVASKSFRKNGFLEARLITRWAEIVGEDIARATLPQHFRRSDDGGTLTVRASGAAALELQHYTPQILDRIAAYFGYRAVTRLKLVQGPLPPRRPRGRVRRVILPPEEAASLDALTAPLADEKLRAALQHLGRGVIGRRLSTEKRR